MQTEAEIGHLITELYSLISGPEGFKRDWQRQVEFFVPYAKVIRTSLDSNGNPQAVVMNIQDYPASKAW